MASHIQLFNLHTVGGEPVQPSAYLLPISSVPAPFDIEAFRKETIQRIYVYADESMCNDDDRPQHALLRKHIRELDQSGRIAGFLVLNGQTIDKISVTVFTDTTTP